MNEFSQCNCFLSVKLPCPSLAEAALDPPTGFTLLALRSCLLRPAYHTSPSPSSQLQSISMASIPSTPTCHRFLSCSLYERMHSLCSSTSSRGSSVLPRSAGRCGGGEQGRGCPFCFQMGFTESLFSVTFSHSSLILSNFTQDFTVSPRRFGKEGHHLFSYSSASLHTQHRLLPQPSETPLGHTGVICPSTILYQDVSCSIVLASNPSTIVVQPVSISSRVL